MISVAKVKEFLKNIEEKVSNKQQNIPTILDNYFLQQGQAYINQEDIDSKLLESLIFSQTFNLRRLVPVYERVKKVKSTELNTIAKLYSQGKKEPFQWKGKPLFKSIYDMAVYQLLIYDLNPGTIIEIGATESSLNWFYDMTRLLSPKTQVYGFNIKNVNSSNCKFIQGDARYIEYYFTEKVLGKLEHPLLIIEDCHVNTEGILTYFSHYMKYGDYIIIEDSLPKQSILESWSSNISEFYTDTYFTDYFGINTVSAINSIIIKSKGVF
ncbi:cephalosporin hydroxylase [Parageobacillus sp. VR-IP]|uniref:CmcI family methyltransferase n=1 Tax=Parageobacillus sp. VR-IP TaxID=2742205 RepID=UPI001583B0BE|nr:CmcI family methyltransferase [Parageobacillus sp. VR-IP]NUK32089.1 cephalosporin hydroxylase [Parageobacillus sp. VR-IP]